eukprot:TRINITY_DN5905_c0_g1_i1.p1 TRINITY_DN5905_c0_g1~~TRINITY_DN5905_c0_g1_i1.p1  ORF type:complete len:394 (+),score=97.95 TRINITY_DN5905_c0_g1_i1:110-1183(+)
MAETTKEQLLARLLKACDGMDARVPAESAEAVRGHLRACLGAASAKAPSAFTAAEVHALVQLQERYRQTNPPTAADTDATDDVMDALLPLAAALAQAPVSHFCVGAVALTRAGAIFLGANMEFPGTPICCSLHAEQSCYHDARHGESGDGVYLLARLAVTHSPCGHCRQFLSEWHGRGATALRVRFQGHTFQDTLSMIPNAFSPADLDLQTPSGTASSTGGMRPADPADPADPLAALAVRAARLSYVPHSGCRSGVALLARSGAVYCGSYLENAAYNPSLQPVIAALSQRNLRAPCASLAPTTAGESGGDNDIVRAVHAEVGPNASQFTTAPITEIVLARATPGVRVETLWVPAGRL